MKRFFTAALTLALSFSICTAVFAAPKWDQTNIAKGYFSLTYDGDLSKIVKVYIQKEGTTNYDIFAVNSNTPVNFPVELGDGNYTVSLLQNVSGDSYRKLESFKFAYKEDTAVRDRFLVPNAYIDYNKDMKFLKYYSTVYEKLSSTNDKVRKFYDDVVHDYSYDTDKAAKIPAGYVPVIDKTFDAKKGICSDYSTLVSGYLRSIGVPTKLIMGYNPEITEYHAWNEIYVDGKWVAIDATYDSAYVRANMPYTMEKDGSKFKVVKSY